VQRHFPPAAKTQLQQMVANITAAFDRRIDGLTWMAPPTRASAKAKLAALKVGIGYPDHWRDYSKIEIVRGDALGNAVRAELFDYQYHLDKLAHPPDRSEWWLTPQTVNAVNLPVQNALNFPAAILEPPFYDAAASAAIRYAAVGAIIGHEISHSFDDQGSQFDAEGRFTNWWTPEDLAHFKAASAALVAQYNAYAPFPDLHVNGQLTLSENIADVAGLSIGVSSSATVRPGGTRSARSLRDNSCSPMATRPANTAPTRSVTSTRGTAHSTSRPASVCISPRRTGCACGDHCQFWRDRRGTGTGPAAST
jgi:putative endopeptidase